jgi:hypothetical protein
MRAEADGLGEIFFPAYRALVRALVKAVVTKNPSLVSDQKLDLNAEGRQATVDAVLTAQQPQFDQDFVAEVDLEMERIVPDDQLSGEITDLEKFIAEVQTNVAGESTGDDEKDAANSAAKVSAFLARTDAALRS